MKIRPYQEADLSQVLSIFRKNVPKYFDPSEEEDLIHYLQKEKEEYFVIETNGSLVGSGGINYFKAENKARISWDFFDPDYQGKGLGQQLLEHRIKRIKAQTEYKQIVVRTSQLAYQFYGKSGFQLQYIKEDFWAPGLHLYFMELEC